MERYLYEMDRKWRGIYIKWTANGEASNGQKMELTANGCNMSQMDVKWNGRYMEKKSQVGVGIQFSNTRKGILSFL